MIIQNRKTRTMILLCFVILPVVIVGSFILWHHLSEKNDEPSNDPNPYGIEVGMTYAEIVDIMGTPGEDIASGAIVMKWKISDTESLSVEFRSGSANNLNEMIAISVTTYEHSQAE